MDRVASLRFTKLPELCFSKQKIFGSRKFWNEPLHLRMHLLFAPNTPGFLKMPLLANTFAALCRVPILRKFIWKGWYQFLAGIDSNRPWTFMNYGYESLDKPLAITLDPRDEADRYSIQLYHAVIGTTPLANKNVLEVGSGRGGGASYIQRYFKPGKTVGMDYSGRAVAFCSRIHQVPGRAFRQGDAEALPFPDETFDVVLNVESSHCYGSLEAFFSEVRRVLRPGGFFLHTDFRSNDRVEIWLKLLKDSGLEMIRQREITPNVMAALDADNQRKMQLIQETVPKVLVKSFLDFAGMKGSTVYEYFRTREMQYLQFVLKKGNRS